MQHEMTTNSGKLWSRQGERRSVEEVLSCCPVRNPRSRIIIHEEALVIVVPPAGGGWLFEMFKSVLVLAVMGGVTFMMMIAVVGIGQELEADAGASSFGIILLLGIIIGICIVFGLGGTYKSLVNKDAHFEQRLWLSPQGVSWEKRTLMDLRRGRLQSWFVPVERLEIELKRNQRGFEGALLLTEEGKESRAFGEAILEFYGNGENQRIGTIELTWIMEVVRVYYAGIEVKN